jgi:hypothetical protein
MQRQGEDKVTWEITLNKSCFEFIVDGLVVPRCRMASPVLGASTAQIQDFSRPLSGWEEQL